MKQSVILGFRVDLFCLRSQFLIPKESRHDLCFSIFCLGLIVVLLIRFYYYFYTVLSFFRRKLILITRYCEGSPIRPEHYSILKVSQITFPYPSRVILHLYQGLRNGIKIRNLDSWSKEGTQISTMKVEMTISRKYS